MEKLRFKGTFSLRLSDWNAYNYFRRTALRALCFSGRVLRSIRHPPGKSSEGGRAWNRSASLSPGHLYQAVWMQPRLLQAPPSQTSVVPADSWPWRLQSSGGSSERLLIRLPKGCSPRCHLPAKVLGQLFGCSGAFFPPLPCLRAPLGVFHRSRHPRAPS